MQPITQGYDHNYFRRVQVTDGYFHHNPDDACDVFFQFRGQLSFSMVNEGLGIVEYSFNGNTLHGDMTPGTPTHSIFFDNRRISKIWFRLADGNQPASRIRVEAWAAM